MTPEEILAMQPGVEMDMIVAQKVMGHFVIKDNTLGYLERLVGSDGSTVWSVVEPYSQDISAAKSVVNKMSDLGYESSMDDWEDFGKEKDTEPEAICKLSLLAILEITELEETSDKILKQALGSDEKNNT